MESLLARIIDDFNDFENAHYQSDIQPIKDLKEPELKHKIMCIINNANSDLERYVTLT